MLSKYRRKKHYRGLGVYEFLDRFQMQLELVILNLLEEVNKKAGVCLRNERYHTWIGKQVNQAASSLSLISLTISEI